MINLDKKQKIILILVGAVVLLVIGYYISTKTEENSYEQLETISEQQFTQTNENVENQDEEIVIHIAGEIKNPGIVRTKQGARIADIIEQAGGLNQDADITNINLAYIVEDGQKIIIPSKTAKNEQEINNEINEEEPINNISETNTKTININKATIEELQQLQGIGEATAQKIIEYRKKNGNFKQIEDLKNVQGIGDAKFNVIKDKIKIK